MLLAQEKPKTTKGSQYIVFPSISNPWIEPLIFLQHLTGMYSHPYVHNMTVERKEGRKNEKKEKKETKEGRKEERKVSHL